MIFLSLININIFTILQLLFTTAAKELLRYSINTMFLIYRRLEFSPEIRPSVKAALRLVILGASLIGVGMLMYPAGFVILAVEMVIAGFAVLLLGIWNLLMNRVVPGVIWSNIEEFEDDQRHLSNRIGSGEQVTLVATATIRNRRYRVNKSFVNFIVANNTGVIPYQTILEKYMLDKYALIDRELRIEMMHDTCYVAYYCLLLSVAEKRERMMDCEARARATGVYVGRMGYYAREVSRRPWLILGFWVLFFGASAALSSSARTYLNSFGQKFNPDSVAAPRPLREGVSLVAGIRTKQQRTYSTALRHTVPRLRNQEFDRHDPDNVYSAFRYRLAVKNPTPIITPEMERIIDDEVDKLASMYDRDKYPPVDPDDICAVHAWIESRPYTAPRKQQLHKAADIREDEKVKRREPFIKNETYIKKNKPRAIVAANDEIKTRLGPIFHGANEWFSHMFFSVKHMTPRERINYLKGYFNGSRFFATDHTSFEVSFIPAVQRMFEQKFYRKIIDKKYWDDLDSLMKPMKLKHRETGTKMNCPAIRCSGEMNTSLGNTISNYLSIQVAARMLHVEVKCVVEGDDALIQVPDDLSKDNYQRIMERMGFNIKIDEFSSPNEAGFCHLHWDADGQPIQEVIPRLPDLFWGDNKSLTHMSREELLQAKLTSLAYDDNTCPCLWKFFTGGERRMDLDLYHAEKYHAKVSGDKYSIQSEAGCAPSHQHRMMFAQINGLSVEDQLIIEEMNLDLCQTIELMYLNSRDPSFAYEMYCLQVEE